jgi:hypothetical protein
MNQITLHDFINRWHHWIRIGMTTTDAFNSLMAECASIGIQPPCADIDQFYKQRAKLYHSMRRITPPVIEIKPKYPPFNLNDKSVKKRVKPQLDEFGGCY